MFSISVLMWFHGHMSLSKLIKMNIQNENILLYTSYTSVELIFVKGFKIPSLDSISPFSYCSIALATLFERIIHTFLKISSFYSLLRLFQSGFHLNTLKKKLLSSKSLMTFSLLSPFAKPILTLNNPSAASAFINHSIFLDTFFVFKYIIFHGFPHITVASSQLLNL